MGTGGAVNNTGVEQSTPESVGFVGAAREATCLASCCTTDEEN
jgi:hypothetical protein